MSGRCVYVFLHLPKTGGTTFTGHLHQHLPAEELLIQGPGADREREELGIAPPAAWPADRLDRVRVITGHGADIESHQLLPDRSARHITFIRDPAPLMVSRFNFDVSRSGDKVDFGEWYLRQGRNPTFRRLRRLLGARSLEETEAMLRQFWFVGATESLDDDLPHLFAAIGVPTEWVNRRVAGAGKDVADLHLPGAADPVPVERHAVLTDEIETRVHIDHPLDTRLHRLAFELRAGRREALGWNTKVPA